MHYLRMQLVYRVYILAICSPCLRALNHILPTVVNIARTEINLYTHVIIDHSPFVRKPFRVRGDWVWRGTRKRSGNGQDGTK